MKNILFKLNHALLICGALLFFKCSAQKNIPAASWNNSPVHIDGSLSEWKTPLKYFDATSQIAYSISNDFSNVFLAFKIKDEAMQMKILRTGMVVGFDTLGKKKEHLSIAYPLRNFRKSKGQQPSLDEAKNNFFLQKQYMILAGFNSGNGESLTLTDDGVRVKLDWNKNGEMVYELAIPFKSFRNSDITAKSIEKAMALFVSIPALERPKVDAVSGATQKNGRGGGPGNKQRTILFEEQKIRQGFLLVLH